MNKYWDIAWAEQQKEQLNKTKVPQSEWRASGRISKANPNKEDGDWWNTNGPLMVDKWIAWRNGTHPWVLWEPSPGIPAIELGMTPVWNNVPVQMHIDRVMVNPDGELVIIDIKTGSRTPTSDLQLGFYAVGMEDTFGVRPKYGAYWMAREGQVKELVDLDKYKTEDIKEMVSMFDKARRDSIFLPNLTHCPMCNVKQDCKWSR